MHIVLLYMALCYTAYRLPENDTTRELHVAGEVSQDSSTQFRDTRNITHIDKYKISRGYDDAAPSIPNTVTHQDNGSYMQDDDSEGKKLVQFGCHHNENQCAHVSEGVDDNQYSSFDLQDPKVISELYDFCNNELINLNREENRKQRGPVHAYTYNSGNVALSLLVNENSTYTDKQEYAEHQLNNATHVLGNHSLNHHVITTRSYTVNDLCTRYVESDCSDPMMSLYNLRESYSKNNHKKLKSNEGDIYTQVRSQQTANIMLQTKLPLSLCDTTNERKIMSVYNPVDSKNMYSTPQGNNKLQNKRKADANVCNRGKKKNAQYIKSQLAAMIINSDENMCSFHTFEGNDVEQCMNFWVNYVESSNLQRVLVLICDGIIPQTILDTDMYNELLYGRTPTISPRYYDKITRCIITNNKYKACITCILQGKAEMLDYIHNIYTKNNRPNACSGNQIAKLKASIKSYNPYYILDVHDIVLYLYREIGKIENKIEKTYLYMYLLSWQAHLKRFKKPIHNIRFTAYILYIRQLQYCSPKDKFEIFLKECFKWGDNIGQKYLNILLSKFDKVSKSESNEESWVTFLCYFDTLCRYKASTYFVEHQYMIFDLLESHCNYLKVRNTILNNMRIIWQVFGL